MEGGWLSDGHNDAMNLWDQANAADPNSTHSVISWMGYDAPDSFSRHARRQPGPGARGRRGVGGRCQRAVGTHQDPPQHVTVIGHSYGSTTVADAFAGSGMHANDAVLHWLSGNGFGPQCRRLPPRRRQRLCRLGIDRPGQLDRNGAGYLHDYLNGELRYPFGLNAGLGLDPAGDEFGSIRFDAEVAGRDGIDTTTIRTTTTWAANPCAP